MKKIETQYAMRAAKYNDLKTVFTHEEIDIFMLEIAKIAKKSEKKLKKVKKIAFCH